MREFREYSIPTIEISLDDDSSIEDVITLFVDINQQGEPVNRFDIVKAMYKGDALMKSVFSLLAVEERRGQDIHYRPKKNEFTDVLKRLQVVDNISAPNSKVDKMWEKLLEIAVFARSGVHRNPVAILKDFITPNRPKQLKLGAKETKELRAVFRFLSSLRKELGESRIFADQTHSYTVVTSILRGRLLETYDSKTLRTKLTSFSALLDNGRDVRSKKISSRLREYRDLSAKQTTHVSRRIDRDRLFLELIELL